MTPPNTLSVIFPKYLLHNDFQEVLSDKRGEGKNKWCTQLSPWKVIDARIEFDFYKWLKKKQTIKLTTTSVAHGGPIVAMDTNWRRD